MDTAQDAHGGNPQNEASRRRVMLRCSRGEPTIGDFVDDACVAQGTPGNSLFWQPRSAGSYRVRVVDDHGRSDERLLEVSLVQ